eukprot:GHVP01047474.1.p1 GENE.GHVP01047474.1~~GHVP01047474.1.p1  ORF type:complete len:600 (+),score=151.67 GHVP01047474.1:28-1827(+)
MSEDGKEGQLRIVILNCEEFDLSPDSATSCCVVLGENEGKSQVVTGSRPVWNAAFQFPFDGEKFATLELYDSATNKMLAEGAVMLEKTLEKGSDTVTVEMDPKGLINVQLEFIEAPSEATAKLTVGIVKAEDLIDKEPDLPFMPLCTVELIGSEQKFSTPPGRGKSPVFKERFDFDYSNEQQLKFGIIDQTTGNVVSECIYDLWSARKHGEKKITGVLPLLSGTKPCGKLYLILVFWDPKENDPEAENQASDPFAVADTETPEAETPKPEVQTTSTPEPAPAATPAPAAATPAPTAATPPKPTSSHADRAKAASDEAKKAVGDQENRKALGVEDNPMAGTLVEEAANDAKEAEKYAATAAQSESDGDEEAARKAADEAEAARDRTLKSLMCADAMRDANRAREAAERAKQDYELLRDLLNDNPDIKNNNALHSMARKLLLECQEEAQNASEAALELPKRTSQKDIQAYQLEAMEATEAAIRLADELNDILVYVDKAAKKLSGDSGIDGDKGNPAPSQRFGIVEDDSTYVQARSLSIRSVDGFLAGVRNLEELVQPKGACPGFGGTGASQFHEANFSVHPLPVIEGEIMHDTNCCGFFCR